MAPAADTVVTALCDAPAAVRGLVRDLRIRWALEEIGRPYRSEIHPAMRPRPAEYRAWQPFGQVPAFAEGDLRLFESGAMLLYLGEQDTRLLPAGRDARWCAICWLMAALNSVEPAIMPLLFTDVIHRGQPWTEGARPVLMGFVERRLADVATALEGKDWLAGDFTIADIAMVTVLRALSLSGGLAGFPVLAAYAARGEARAAFQRALADQLADLGDPIAKGA